MAWDQDDLEQIMNREITTFRGWKIYLLSYLLSFTNSWQVSTTEHGAYYYGLVTVPPPWEIHHHTGNNVPFSVQTVCRLFNVPQILYVPGLWDRAYCLLSLPEGARGSNHRAFLHLVFPTKLKSWWSLLMQQRSYRLKRHSNCHSIKFDNVCHPMTAKKSGKKCTLCWDFLVYLFNLMLFYFLVSAADVVLHRAC